MSSHDLLPSQQRLHISMHEEHHDVHLNGDSSGSQETSAPPPSYTVSDSFGQFDPDAKHRPTEDQVDPAFVASPSQLPFDDLTAGSLRPSSSSVISRTPDSLEPRMPHLQLETQRNFTQKPNSHNSSKTSQQQSTDSPHTRQRPELPHSPSSTPDTRKLLRKISELDEVGLSGESPFEAGRRAQRATDRDAMKTSSPNGQLYVNGRFPSIKPGEIMPSKLFLSFRGPPSFFPPLEAPPFPPAVHSPIRPAHFPPSLHPPLPTSEPVRTPSQQQPPSQHMPQIHRSASVAPPNLVLPHAGKQPSRELLRSQSQLVVPHSVPPQPTRTHPHEDTPPPNGSRHQGYSDAPLPSRRHTLDPQNGNPPGLTPNGRHPVPQQPPPIPHALPPPRHPPPQGPPPLAQSQHNLPPPTRSAFRDPHRQSLTAPPPSHGLFPPQGPSPVRLPSQNVPTPQALGIARSPPTPSGSPRSDNSRPPRATPKPVMPQLLARLEAQEPNRARDGASQLQRSVSSAAIRAPKEGILAKTKSILRKRSSTSGIKTHTDGAISFSPTMPNLMEENDAGSRKLGKRLSRKK